MIPLFNDQGLLPAGIHHADWNEVIKVFGFTKHRQKLLLGLRAGLKNLHFAGCQKAYLDGSFVSSKPNPADFDVCWESAGVNPVLLEAEMLLFSHA